MPFRKKFVVLAILLSRRVSGRRPGTRESDAGEIKVAACPEFTPRSGARRESDLRSDARPIVRDADFFRDGIPRLIQSNGHPLFRLPNWCKIGIEAAAFRQPLSTLHT